MVGANQPLEPIRCEVVGVDEQTSATPRRSLNEIDVLEQRTGGPQQRVFMAYLDGHGLLAGCYVIYLRCFPAIDKLVNLVCQIVRIDQYRHNPEAAQFA